VDGRCAVTKQLRWGVLAALACVAALLAVGCSPRAVPVSPSPVQSVAPTDYSVSANWLSAPTTGTKEVDVFYLYPTEYHKPTTSSPMIGAVDDPGMIKGARAAFARQATAFDTVGDIYAPYYRQLDIASRFAMSQEKADALTSGQPTDDAIAAFDYYIEHYNKGRPYILAGHSLGSDVLARLLERYMPSHPDVYKRMVAAYAIGYSITPDYLSRNPLLKFAEGANDTGVIVSYNTEAPAIGARNPVTLPGGLAINPITWTRTEATATADQNRGSISLQTDGYPVTDPAGEPVVVPQLADARVDTARGVVICSTVDVSLFSPGGKDVWPKGVYHTFDYPFYYFDLRANAADRVAAFLATNPK
jgi:hypothetical protein